MDRKPGAKPIELKPPRLPPGLSCYKAFRPHHQHPERPFDFVAEAIKGNEKFQEYAEKARNLYRKIEAAAPVQRRSYGECLAGKVSGQSRHQPRWIILGGNLGYPCHEYR